MTTETKKSVKKFKARISLFHQICETNPYVQGFYDVCILQMALFFAFIILRDSFYAGRPYIDLSKEIRLFGTPVDWTLFALVESCQLLCALCIHPFFQVWRQVFSSFGSIAHPLFIVLYAVYVIGSGVAVVMVIHWLEFPPVFKVISTIEQMRLAMKSYSFVRENAYKVLYPWHKDDETGPAVWYEGQMEPKVGSFSHYVYFLFAPAMLYRDNYPRNEGPINWNNAVIYAMQFLTTVYAGYVLFAELVFASSFYVNDLVNSFLISLLLGPLMNILGCVQVLHTWSNFTAELTRFADRKFHEDWWNSESYATYYRKWNIPIHDWLHAYIYQDLRTVIKSRGLAALPAFLASSLMHDYQMGVAMGFVTPIFLVMFAGIGGVMFLVRPSSTRMAQVLTFAGLSLGVSIFVSFYTMELAARSYCPLQQPAIFTLRTSYCFHYYNQ